MARFDLIARRNLQRPPITIIQQSNIATCRYLLQRTISMCIVIPNLIRCAYQLSNNKTNLSCRSAASYLNCVAVIGLPAAHNKLRHRRGDILNGDYLIHLLSLSLSLSLCNINNNTLIIKPQAAWLACCNQTMLDRR